MTSQNYDFLVIGSGIAGLTAALRLAEKGRVLIITKANLLESSSRYAQAGIAAVRNFAWDSFAEHARDTITAGAGLNDRRAVNFLVERAPGAVAWLEKIGVRFAREPTREAAHSHSRVWHTRDSTGATIEKALAKKVRAHKNIQILTNTIVLDLIVKLDSKQLDSRTVSANKCQILNTNTNSNPKIQRLKDSKTKDQCFGAFVKTGKKIYPLFADQTILATGGYGQLFARTTNPAVSTGDGIVVAHRAGVKLKDLEFVQFHPTALVGEKLRLTLLSESLRGEGAVLRNARGERFMTSHHVAAELAPRDIVARAIYAELKCGPVYLDFTRAEPKWLKSRFPLIWREVKKAGFNLARNQIPIFPVAHYACGGMVTNLHGETNLRNLFAVGEVACTGVHGANRLASNSLAEAVVFGLAVGKQGKRQKTKDKSNFFEIPKYIFDLNEDKKIIPLVRKLMWEHVGIIRTRSGLALAREELAKLHPKSLPSVNAVTVARLITRAAWERKKSVGTHYVTAGRNKE